MSWDALSQASHWDEKTRQVVLDRVELNEIAVRILQGSMVIEANGFDKDLPLKVTTGDLKMDIIKDGIYLFADGKVVGCCTTPRIVVVADPENVAFSSYESWPTPPATPSGPSSFGRLRSRSAVVTGECCGDRRFRRAFERPAGVGAR